MKTLKNPLIISSGDVISQDSPHSSVKITLNGYLVDEDFFESSSSGSGGSGSNSGGSSGSSSGSNANTLIYTSDGF